MFPLIVLLFGTGNAIAQQPGPTYSPLRPPSVPLAVRSPYTSTWSTTSNDSTLNNRNATFWNGKTIGWTGIVRVDGTSYEYMGDSPFVDDLHKAIPLTVSYDSHFSNFTFVAGPVRVEARFFSPVLPKDLCKSSVPLSYLEVAYVATDGISHDVQVYSDVDTSWLAGGNSTMRWGVDCPGESFGEYECPSKGTETPETLFHWEAEILDQISWFDRGYRDEPYWGKLHYISSPSLATEFNFANGLAATTRQRFVRDGALDRSIDQDQPRRPDDRVPVFAYSHGFTSSHSGSVLYTVGTAQEPAVHYRTVTGDIELQPWWLTNSCYFTIDNMIRKHYQDYLATAKEAKIWSMQLRHDVAIYYAEDKATDNKVKASSMSEEESYYAILALSTRQILAANVLTESADNATGPTIFQKEISSDGKLLRLLLKPIFEFQESGLYHEKYAMHDIGRYYPDAIGYSSSSVPYQNGEEAMPVEESANMIILAYSYFVATNNTEYLATHFDVLKRWTAYVIDNGLYPEHQATTDDFNEPLANNTNLAIKGIVAINCMGAWDYYDLWAASAIDPTNTHTLLAYQLPSSYSILYNIYPALLFNLRPIPKSLFLMESAFYPTVAQEYGVPIDNRHLWTKSDWEMWAAATSQPQTRALFVMSLAKWINETSTDKALTDHYMTTGDGGYPDYPFIARPVVGGHFSLLAMGMYGRHGVSRDWITEREQ